MLPIIACNTNLPTEKFLFGGSPLGAAVLRHVCKEILSTGISGKCKALSFPKYRDQFESAGLTNIQTISEQPNLDHPLFAISRIAEIVQPKSKNIKWLLIVSPGAGPVSASRIFPLLKTIANGSRASVIVSTLPVPPNLNPIWLKAINNENVQNNRIPSIDFHKNLDFKFSLETKGGPIPVFGSQWLPEFKYFDGAVAAIRTSAIGHKYFIKRCDFISTDLGTGIPLLYKLPFYQLSPEDLIQWKVSEEDVYKLI